jgi:hypothetical protein
MVRACVAANKASVLKEESWPCATGRLKAASFPKLSPINGSYSVHHAVARELLMLKSRRFS